MAFSLTKILKGLLISEENTLLPKEIEIVPAGTANTKTSIVSSQTANRTLTLPNATDTLVGKATVDVLTNKSFDADGAGNLITNIENADIKSGAAIDATKIANGSVSNSEFQQLDGLTSPAVGTTQAQTLESKTIVVANNTLTTAASGNLVATELNAALAELQSDIDSKATSTDLTNHINDAVAAHTASAIANVPSGNLVATNVQAALNEIQTELDSVVVSAGANQALSNLTSTAVNASIVPNLDETINLGSITRRYDTVYTDMVSYTDSFSTPSLSAKDRTLFDTAGGTALSFASTTELNVNNKKITALATPTVGADAANKTYVDSRTPNNFVQSSAAPNFGTNSTSYVDVTNLSVVFTTTGRLLEIGLIPTTSFSLFRLIPQGLGSEANLTGSIRIFNVTSSNTIYETSVGNTFPTNSITNAVRIPSSSIRQYITLAAGTYTVKVQMAVNTSNANILLDQVKLFVREL